MNPREPDLNTDDAPDPFASVYELILRGIVVTGLCVLVACWLGVV